MHHNKLLQEHPRVWRESIGILKKGGLFSLSNHKRPWKHHTCTWLTLSVPGGHGDDPADPSLSHGADHRRHGEGVARHPRKEGGREAEAGHDHILSFEMRCQTVCWENITFHHLAAERETHKDSAMSFTFHFFNTLILFGFFLTKIRSSAPTGVLCGVLSLVCAFY